MSEPTLFGRDLFGEPIKPPSRGLLSDRFIVPPFSVWNARDGAWQNRKRAWLAYGIKSEVGRDEDLTFKITPDFYSTEKNSNVPGTSVFDPVVCELVYRWFCPPGGQVVDPFAGGSVRGIVAALLGRRYWGCDLRADQITANEEQAAEIVPDARPSWVTADAIEALPSAPPADLIFTCPPYGDLERYSDDPRDLSSMEYNTFCAAYRRIVMRAVSRLKPDRFAVFVVGDFRNPKTGMYRGFPAETMQAFREQGCELYNEAILVTSVGSLPIRAGKQFAAGRKLGKTHQNVLVFVKGDPKRAARACAR